MTDTETFLSTFRRQYPADVVLSKMRALADLRVMVIGDTIIDEYHFCRPYGMPLKSPVIAAQFLEAEAHAGGVLAVANHLAGFCRDVHLVTGLGEHDSRESFVREHLTANVTPQFFTIPGAPTTVKRRYLRRFLMQKMFEISFFDDQPPPGDIEQAITQHIFDTANDYDLVVVSDFGHGFITANMIEAMCRKARYLSINTQLNSINYGFNVATKYPRADYVCLDEEEARMACRDRSSSLPKLIESLRKDLDGCMIAVTQGHQGSVTFPYGQAAVSVPVLSRNVVDTIGAGDAYFALSAPCAALGFPPELIAFIGNVAGAVAVTIIGNQHPVETKPFAALVQELLAP